jgi:hypothetical protein
VRRLFQRTPKVHGRAALLVLLNYVIGNKPDIGNEMPATSGCA